MSDDNVLEAIDADEAKKVVLMVLDFASDIAAMTPTPLDDKVVATVQNLIERPLVWNLVVSIINRAIPEDGAPEAAAVAEEEAGIPITTVVTLITTLLPLIKAALAWWKQRKQTDLDTITSVV